MIYVIAVTVFVHICVCKYICIHIGICISVCVCMDVYIYYILFVVRVEHHDVGTISDFWSQRFIMIALTLFYLNHRFEVVVTLRGKLALFTNVKNVV